MSSCLVVTRVSMEVIVTIVSKLVDFTYLPDVQPTYTVVIIHLLSTMDIPVHPGKSTSKQPAIFHLFAKGRDQTFTKAFMTLGDPNPLIFSGCSWVVLKFCQIHLGFQAGSQKKCNGHSGRVAVL